MPVTQGAGLPPNMRITSPSSRLPGKGSCPPPLNPSPRDTCKRKAPPPQIAPPSQGVALPQMLPGNVSEVAQPQHLPEQQLPAGTQPPSAPVVPSQVASSVPPRYPAYPLTRAGLGQGAPLPASALYASLPSFTATQLEDATQRLLFQHPSLFSLPKLAAAEKGLEPGASLGPQDGNATNALPVSAGLFPLKSLPVDGEEDSSSGASVVAIDNKIEQAMDLVKSHLMYAVREEVEVLKEQIKELIDRNSQLEQENNLLKNLASPEQLAQFQAQVQSGSPPPSAAVPTGGQPPLPPAPQTSGPSA